MNRSERIEKALKEISRQLGGWTGPVADIKSIADEALKPEIDWQNVPMGSVVMNELVNTERCKFVLEVDDRYIKVLKDNMLYNWTKKYCTVEIPKRTKLIKHAWPEDEEKPDWVNGNDMIITSYVMIDGSYQLQLATSISWSIINKRTWFAVLDVINGECDDIN